MLRIISSLMLQNQTVSTFSCVLFICDSKININVFSVSIIHDCVSTSLFSVVI